MNNDRFIKQPHLSKDSPLHAEVIEDVSGRRYQVRPAKRHWFSEDYRNPVPRNAPQFARMTDTSFAGLRGNGFTYVDKTAQILPLVNMSIGKQFFMARPRRFGKSLLVSMLQCLFEGRRELFEGLAIEDKWDWSKWSGIGVEDIRVK